MAAIVVPVFFLATVVTFALGALSGLSPAASLSGDEATPERIAAINAELGLDQPVHVQYLTWIAKVLTGDLGVSWYNGFPVAQLIGERLAVTASIAALALLIALAAGTALGLTAVLFRGRGVDRGITAFATAISTLPPFVVSLGLIVVLAVWLRLLPSSGYVPPTEAPVLWFRLLLMPPIPPVLDPAADIARQLPTGLVHVLDQHHILHPLVPAPGGVRPLSVHPLRNGPRPPIRRFVRPVRRPRRLAAPPAFVGGRAAHRRPGAVFPADPQAGKRAEPRPRRRHRAAAAHRARARAGSELHPRSARPRARRGSHPVGACAAQRRRARRRHPRDEDPDASGRRRGDRDDLQHAGIRDAGGRLRAAR